jgi:hypothetical protein
MLLFLSYGIRSYFIAVATGYSKVCVEGVTYLQFTTGSTIQIDKNGKYVPCTN